MTFTQIELEYLATQRLGRLATIAPDGYPQNNPVGFFVDAERGTIDIGGHRLGASRKFASVQANPRLSFVVDDLASVQPWRVARAAIRRRGQALTDHEAPLGGVTREPIRPPPRPVPHCG